MIPLCIHYRGVLAPWRVWHQQVFLQTNVGRIPGEPITNTKNSTNIWQNPKFFLGMSNGARRSCAIKKKKTKNLVTLSFYYRGPEKVNFD